MTSHDVVESGQINLDEKRRNALAEIDNAKFGWFHVRTIVVTGVGFFTDAYDLFAINFVTAMLGYVYYGGTLPTNIDLGVKISAQCGTFLGQLLFGWLGDLWGRKRMYGIELMIMIIATLGSALCAESFAVSVTGSLIMWRVILGIGIGGDYPMSAVISSEFANRKRRGAMIGAVFAMQGFGILSAAIVSTIILAIYKPHIQGDVNYIDYCWRILVGVGAVPAVVALYFRLTIPETPRYTIDIERNVTQAADDIAVVLGKKKQDKEVIEGDGTPDVDAPKHSWQDFKAYFGKWENGKILLGTSLSWFLLDVAFYGLGLNNSIILKNIGFASSPDPFQSLWNISIGNILIAVLGTVPGYWFTVFLVDVWGRKPIQLMGFGVLTVLFLVLGVAYDQLKTRSAVFIVIFTLSQFFQNFGPNTTTFIIPGEVFPTRYRSTGHGISAASGKLGAIIAQVGFLKLKDLGGKNNSINKVIIVCAPIMFLGIFSTLLIPETKDRSLEDLSNENQVGFVTGKTDRKSHTKN